MERLIQTIKGERSLDQAFTLWFLIIVATNVINLGLEAAIKNSATPGLYVFLGVIVAIVQVLVVYLIGSGVLRSAFGSDRPKAFRITASLLVIIAMVRLPLSYADVFSFPEQPSPVTSVAAREAPAHTVADGATRDVSGRTGFQRELLADFRQKLPVKVDALTTLVAVDIEGTAFIYRYRLDGSLREGVDVEAERQLKLAEMCLTLKKLFRPAEVESISHRFIFNGGKKVTFDVAMKDCRNTDPGATTADGPLNFIKDFEQRTGIDL